VEAKSGADTTTQLAKKTRVEKRYLREALCSCGRLFLCPVQHKARPEVVKADLFLSISSGRRCVYILSGGPDVSCMPHGGWEGRSKT
jgi:hypothetical protein